MLLHRITPLLVLLAMAACDPRVRSDVDTSQPAAADPVQQLQALAEGDAIADARTAFARGDTRLWSWNTRQQRIVPAAAQLADGQATRTAPAMSDTLYSQQHLQARQRFIDYATRYNSEMLRLLAQ